MDLARTQSVIINAVFTALKAPVPTRALIKQLVRMLPRSTFLEVLDRESGTSKMLIKQSLLPGVVAQFTRTLRGEGLEGVQIERILCEAGLVVDDAASVNIAARVEEHARVCQAEFDAQVKDFRLGIMTTLMRELNEAGTDREKILDVARKAFRMLGVGGVNVYIYDQPSKHLLCLQSEQMLGISRYDRSQGKKAWKPAEGAKAYILSKADGCYVIRDRMDLRTWNVGIQDTAAISFFEQEKLKALADADLYKKPGTGLEDGKKNIGEEVYVKIKGANGHAYLFVGNSHLKNMESGYKAMFEDIPGGEETARQVCDEVSGLISTALKGAYLRTSLEVRSRQLEAVSVLSRKLDVAISHPEADSSLPQIVGQALPQIFKRLDRASIIIWDHEAKEYKVAVAWGQGYHPDRNYNPADFAFTDWVVSGRESIFYSTHNQDDALGFPFGIGGRRFYERGDFIVVPFYGRDVRGVITITSELRRHLTKDDQSTLEQIALHLSSKMANDNLVRELRYLAEHDIMTGLWNKRVGLDRLNSAFLAASPEKPVSVIGIDMDHFKLVNDTYGHIAGDKVLIELAQRMESAAERKVSEILMRKNPELLEADARLEAKRICTVMRYGGEEFNVIIEGLGHEEAVEVGEAIGAEIRKSPFDLGGGLQLNKTASIGVASTSQYRFISPDDLLKAADTACYAAKLPDKVVIETATAATPLGLPDTGRDRTLLWVPGMKQVA